MKDGVILYTNTSITTCLGYPKDMWLGRSFIDFVHPKVYIRHNSQTFSITKCLRNQDGQSTKDLQNQKSALSYKKFEKIVQYSKINKYLI